MSNNGIREFQDMLDEPLLPLYLRGHADRVLWKAQIKVSNMPLTWTFLNDVVEALKASSPWVSMEPIHVKAREIAPHLLKELWCETGRIKVAAGDVASRLGYAEAFGIYAECHMDDKRLELDWGFGTGKGSLLDNCRELCAVFACRVLLDMAEWDLDPEV